MNERHWTLTTILLLALPAASILTSVQAAEPPETVPPAAEGYSGQAVARGEEEHASADVHLGPQQREMLNIEVDEAPGGTADSQISAAANIRFDPDLTAQVGPRLDARVVEVLVDLGERVESGQALVVMDSVMLGRAKADYLRSQARLASAREAFERDQSLAEQQITSQAELAESRAALGEARAEHRAATETLKLYGLSRNAIDSIEGGDQPLSRFTLTARSSGVVEKRDLAPGQNVSADESPIHIVDTSEVWVMVEAFEQSLPRLAEGQELTFHSRGLGDRRYSGRIDWIARSLDDQSRTVTVRATLDNPEGRLRAGMAGTATIHAPSEQSHYALVPVDAVQRNGEQAVVFVPAGMPGAYRHVPVTLGSEGDGWVEIRQGLQPGDPVVVGGAFDLMSAMTAGSRSADHAH